MNNKASNPITVIKETANKIIPGCRVLLFGSQARKENDPESDYDFLVISKNKIETRRKRALRAKLRKELALQKIPSDIIIESEEELNLKADITGHLLRQVIKEGVML